MICETHVQQRFIRASGISIRLGLNFDEVGINSHITHVLVLNIEFGNE
jgi:hypothetical protein